MNYSEENSPPHNAFNGFPLCSGFYSYFPAPASRLHDSTKDEDLRKFLKFLTHSLFTSSIRIIKIALKGIIIH